MVKVRTVPSCVSCEQENVIGKEEVQEVDPISELELVDTLVTDNLGQLDRQPFQAEDKQIWREGVTLMDCPARYHLRERGSIP